MKINTNSMKKVYEELLNTFCKKNHDYGSSFEQSLDKHGLVAGVVRMEDKMNRLSTLVDSDTDAQIASESLVDTLMDLSNYAAMSACWLMGQDEKNRDEEPTESGKFTGLKVWGDDIAEGFSGSITMGKEEFEEVEKTFHLSSFEGHQEKVNERAYYEKDGVSDEEIIKNWSLVGDSKTLRSRTTGYYLVEDDNPELSRKIRDVLQMHREFNNFVENTNNKFESHIESLSNVSWKPAPEDIVNEPQPFKTELKGLENGYFIRQHINSDNSYRYTIAFNPEGTIKTQDGEEKPYLLECFGNDYDGMNVWAIHVFDTREDMVAALNYDLTVRDKFKSKNFGDSIKGLDIKTSVYAPYYAPQVFKTWRETFGQAFDKQMTSKGLIIEKYFELYQGIKTFGPVFISEKTGALIIKGNIREASFKRSCDFIWFSDTKEVLLEKDDTTPKFNYNGVIYGVIYPHADSEYVDINPVYKDMNIKIISKFNNWDASELKNLVFFNEDEELNSGDSSSENGGY